MRITKSIVPNRAVGRPVNERVNAAGWPNRKMPNTSVALAKWSEFDSGEKSTRAIGASTGGSLPVRYKMSALTKRLIHRVFWKAIPKISFVVRYKMSAWRKRLCWWGFSLNYWILRYKRTSLDSPVAW